MTAPARSPDAAAPVASRPAPPPRKKSRKWLWLFLAGIGLLGLLVALAVMKNAQPRASRVTVEKAIVKTITQVVSATGKIQPEVEVKIAPEVAGEIIELPFREGADVKKGELLVRIKPDAYRYQFEQREADLAAARASALETEVRFQKAEEDFKRDESLHKQNLISDFEFATARADYEMARASLDSAIANIRRAEGLLNQARDQLDKTTIYAPIDGTVSSLTSEVGERVVGTGQFAGTEIMRVADLANMEVRVNINENDIVNVKIDDRAMIAIDAFPGRKFEAIVKEIGSAAQTTGANTQEEVTNFQVKIRILDKSVPIRSGMSANADIETRTVANAVAVPIQSVTVRARDTARTLDQLADARAKAETENKGEGAATAVNTRADAQRRRDDRDNLQRVVFVRHGATVKMVPVETGIADTAHIEIKSGVREGDEVVSGSYAAITRILADGASVLVEPAKKGPPAK
ncbi:efflux RND transporter periplasmic adaptor subunit [Termitidicoccus mucosus]|uniref:Efflux transporter periplasmic adaptor subunit n=1 Tax=Termitidicoccus mucosus TaxID=1184151 RepID=A0A178ICZ5_9BACT|nr:efflux transporter periplasmic adaptor subunit [Opitutaceae bacterium TSB47]